MTTYTHSRRYPGSDPRRRTIGWIAVVAFHLFVGWALVTGTARKGLEMWALSVAVLLGGLFAYYAVRLAWMSKTLNDISTSNDATPLWIPQIAMALGTVVLLVALIDEWVLELRGERLTTGSEEALHNE